LCPLPAPARSHDATYDHSRARFHAGLRVGNDRVCAAISLRLLRTSVDATSFALATLPPVRSLHGSLTGTIDSIQFANARDGYAIVGATGPTSLFVTLNGARTWHRVVVQKGGERSASPLRRTRYTRSRVFARPATRLWRLSHRPISAQCQSMDRLENAYRPFCEDRVWGFPYVPAAYGSEVWISEQPPGPPSSSTPAIAVDRFRSSLPPNWAV